MPEYTQIIAVDPSFQYALLIKRNNDPGKGQLSGIGGMVEENETAEDCALREWKEETQLTEIPPIIKLFSMDNGKCINHIYGAILPSIEIYYQRSFEEGIIRWHHIQGCDLMNHKNEKVAWNGLIPYCLNLLKEGR